MKSHVTTSPRRGRTFLLLLIVLALAPSTRAQEFAFGIGGTSATTDTDQGTDIVLDASGNVYVVGFFRGTNVNFNPGGSALLSSSSSSTNDIFVASYTSAGAYRWAFRVGSTGDDRGFSIAIDGSSNIYVTGYFQGSNVNFNPSGSALLTSTGANDMFLASYTSAGAYRFALRVGSSNNDRGQAVAVGPSGHVYVTGHFQGTNVNFNPSGSALLTSAGSTDIYVASYTNTGTFRSAFRVGSTGADRGHGIVLDASGNLYLTGFFVGPANFDPAGTQNRGSSGNSTDIFVASYTSANAFRWAFNIGSTADDRGHDIALDGSANVYVGGYFRNTSVDFDPSTGGTALRSSNGANDLWVASYTSAGNFRFANTAGTATLNDRVQALTVDGSDNVYITGHFQGSNVDFDPGAGVASMSSQGVQDFYVASYTSAGVFREAFSAGSTGADRGQAIAINGAGRGFTTGFFANTVDFDPGAGTRNATSNGGPDAFVASYTAQTLPVELTTFSGSQTTAGVALRWETATETNNAGFDVERAGAGGAWRSVGFVAGRGTTTAPARYTFTDADLPFEAPSLRYRLRQVDFDGASSYSPEVEIARALPAALGLHAAYPNPFAEETTIRYELPAARDVRIEVFDALGRSVRVLVHAPQPAGRHAVVFRADGLPTGPYVYRIEAGGRIETRRVLLVR